MKNFNDLRQELNEVRATDVSNAQFKQLAAREQSQRLPQNPNNRLPYPE